MNRSARHLDPPPRPDCRRVAKHVHRKGDTLRILDLRERFQRACSWTVGVAVSKSAVGRGPVVAVAHENAFGTYAGSPCTALYPNWIWRRSSHSLRPTRLDRRQVW
jgi:hypothetical protein